MMRRTQLCLEGDGRLWKVLNRHKHDLNLNCTVITQAADVQKRGTEVEQRDPPGDWSNTMV